MKKFLLSIFASAAIFTASNAQLNNLNVGDVAPNFTVTDIHGNAHTLSAYAGKWVVVDLYAYWCGPCAAVAPTINSFYKKYGCNGYDVIVLSVEYEGTQQQTEDFETANGGDLNYPTPSASGLAGGGAAVHTAYGPAAYPTIILIGPDGLVKNEDIWPISGVSTLEAAITSAGGSAALVVNTCGSLAIEEMAFADLNVYPNPSNGELTIQLASPNADVISIEVYDLIGAKVWEQTEVNVVGGQNSISLSIPSITSGHYILKAANSKGNVISQAIQIK